MKNCPWFSLRSNSIESRFRSIRWGNFLALSVVTLRKSKGKSNQEFASLIKLLYSLRSIQTQFSAFDLRVFRLHSLKSCFSEGRVANFGDVARRHSLCKIYLNLRRTKRTECERLRKIKIPKSIPSDYKLPFQFFRKQPSDPERVATSLFDSRNSCRFQLASLHKSSDAN